jgi:DNA-binding NtrC family response regulator
LRRVKVALVVAQDGGVGSLLRSFMSERAELVRVAASKQQAQQCLAWSRVDAAIVDLGLADDEGLDLLQILLAQPSMPHVLVLGGAATPDTAFRLAQAGVRGYVANPPSLERLAEAWEQTFCRPPDLRPLLRASVGRVDLRTIEQAVRDNMIEEALALADSSRRRASSLLGVSRQLLQHMLRRRTGAADTDDR